VPTCRIYDPAYAYEIAVIVHDGIRRMYQENEDCFYYITIYNEFYPQEPMPEGCHDGILRGIYLYRPSAEKAVAQLFGSGPILNEALRAQQLLAENYAVPANVWSVTSYNQLRREALGVERWNRLHPTEEPRRPYIQQILDGHDGPVVAATDYMKMVPDQLAPWLPGRLVSLGADGFGRSENRQYLRRFFEVNAESIVCATLSRLSREGKFDRQRARQAMDEMGVDPEAVDPATA
jgi:pyruvate dehydrogenase E1 component